MKSFAYRTKRRALTTAVSAALFSAAMQAQAQAGNQLNNTNSLEEVVVIGQRFQNSLINRLPIAPEELPFSLDVIDKAMMDERGFFNPLDILETIPNVVRRQTQFLPTSGQYLIRGLDASVLTNNRPENNSRGAGRRDSSHIERMEVLKGPTSILLGPVIPGGVINQVTKSPQADDFLEISSRAGSYDTYRVEADVNRGAFFGSDVWSARMTVAVEDQGTPQDESNAETFSIRPVIEGNFTDRTRVQASFSYTKRESSPGSSFPVNSDGTVPKPIDEETFLGVPGAEHVGDDNYLDVEFQHEFLNGLKLVVRGSHQDTDFEYQNSQGGSNYSGGRGFSAGDSLASISYSAGYRDTEVTYSDVQLLGGFDAFNQRNDWVIGTSYQETKFASFWAYGGSLGSIDIYDMDSASLGVPGFNLTLNPYSDTEDELSSIYAETNLRPTDRLTVVGGLRYDDHEKTNVTSNEVKSNNDTTFRIGATYQLLDGLNTYVSYAESFIPQSGMMRNGSLIDPETATNHEIGFKGNLLAGRLQFTASAFALTRENVATADPENMPNEPYYVVSTGEQEHNGYEVSMHYQASTALRFDFGYGKVDAKVTKVISAGSGQDVGDPIALVPEKSYSAYGSYTVQRGSLADLKLGLGFRTISERTSPRFDIKYDGYTLADGYISYPISETVDVQLNVHNLLDDEYRPNVGYNSGTPAADQRFGNPRSVYLSLRAKF